MSKINIKLCGEVLQVPQKQLITDPTTKEQYIYCNAKTSASLIKQYVKKKYGNRITVWSTSDVYSGGSSVRVNVWSKNGSPTPYTIHQDIQGFANLLKAGRFDGMYDIYEYKDEVITTENGTPLKYFPSYIFVENKPKWGTAEYWLNEWKNWDENNYCETARKRMVGTSPLERFLNFNREYFGKGIEEKINNYISEVEAMIA